MLKLLKQYKISSVLRSISLVERDVTFWTTLYTKTVVRNEGSEVGLL